MKKLLKCVLGALLSAMLLCGGMPLAPASAAELYSDVMSDLSADADFDPSDYPSDASDYSLDVIQIAESEDGELFLYVYRPSAGNGSDFLATSVNIATSEIKSGGSPKNYKLRLLSTKGVFDKYLAEGFELEDKSVRCYDIPSVFRAWDGAVDAAPPAGEKVREVSYEVGKLFNAISTDGTVLYGCLKTDVVTITQKHVGFVQYNDGFLLFNGSCQSHFVAFDTDRDIDFLYEADIYFTSQEYRYGWNYVPNIYDMEHQVQEWREDGPLEDKYVTLTYLDRGEYVRPGWIGPDGIGFGRKYVWNRIEAVDDFKKDVHLTEEATNTLEGMKWVLRFYETPFEFYAAQNTYSESGVNVADVTILRLKFETEGVVYNLGVVDNKQTGSGRPDNIPWLEEATEWAWWKWCLIAAAVCIVLLIVFVPLERQLNDFERGDPLNNIGKGGRL